MKTNKITSTNLNSFPEQKQRAERPRSQSFKGVGTGFIVPLMDGIERGGIAASFTVQDMFGTNFPRTIKGLYRNKDITGEYNFQEAKEVALREFITGPSMFIIPISALLLIRNFAGRAFSVPIKRLDVFSTILGENKSLLNESNLKAGNDVFKQNYYTKVFQNILKSSTTDLSDKEIADNASDFAQRLIKIDSAKSKNIVYKIINKKVAGSKDELLSEFVDKFLALTKASSGEKTKDLLSASLSKNGEIYTSSKITNILSSLSDYTDDILKSAKKKLTSFDENTVGNFISAFTKNRAGARFLLNIALCASVVGFCTTIPKIYMQNKKFPGLKGLVETSNGVQQNQTAATEVKNENK